MQGCQFFVIFNTRALPLPFDVTLSGLLQSSFLNILLKIALRLCEAKSNSIQKANSNFKKAILHFSFFILHSLFFILHCSTNFDSIFSISKYILKNSSHHRHTFLSCSLRCSANSRLMPILSPMPKGSPSLMF